ncbi:MAG TPA: alpha/beta hydrolase [Pirellulales bacterium]|jgi:acetyl esterase/lipase|nr:alpha/beta hydrolase [Pirellulales bacterium]
MASPSQTPCRWLSLLIAALLTAPALVASAADDPKKDAPLPDVRAERDISYYTGPGADKVKHKLDLYLPKGKSDFPIVMFVHGGAWVFGDKDFWGVHEAIGRMFARHGIGAAVISYRLSPAVQHPEHVKDVARAFAWLHENVKNYGGRPDELFVCGHSAGGHLVSLLATDDTYLKAEGLSLADIKGVMPISGVYLIPDKWFTDVFGKDPETRKKASPINDVHAGCPPFCVVYGDDDFPTCGATSERFCEALKAEKVAAESLEIKKRNHIDIITGCGKDDDPCAKALVDFVMKHVASEK